MCSTFKCSIDIKFGSTMASAFAPWAEGTGFESHCVQEFVIFKFSLDTCSHTSGKPMEMESAMTYTYLIPRKIWLLSAVVNIHINFKKIKCIWLHNYPD